MNLARSISTILACSLLCIATSRAADFALLAEPGDLPASNVTPEDESALRLGPLDLRGAAAISFGYDSNVNAVSDPDDAQALATGQLLVRADSHAARHEFNAIAFAAGRRYETDSDLDSTEFGAAARFTRMISARDTFEVSLDAQRRFERHTEIETPTDIPVSLYDDVRFDIFESHAFNRLSITLSGDGRRLQYQADSQDFRDRTMYGAQLRAAYELSGNLSWFATAYYNRDEFDTSTPLNESADTTGALSGVRLDLRDVLEFELGVGQFQRRFDHDGTLSGLALRGALEWRPTRLTQLRAELTRSDEPTQVPGAFGKIHNEALLRLSHDYSREVSLFAAARIVLDEFDTLDRNDTLYLAEVGANWSFGRHSALRFTYDYGSRSTETFDRGFVRNVASLSYVGRM